MIRRIRVKNFKSLKDVSLTLGLRNVLVGPNMSGKSNFVDVFRFLARMVFPAPGTYGVLNALTTLGGFSEVVWKGGDSNLISISLDGDGVLGSGLEKQVPWSYEISILGDVTRGSVTVQEEVLRVSGPNGTYNLVDTVDGQRVLKNSDGAVLSRVDRSDRSALEFEIPDWEGNAFRWFVGSWRFYRLLPQRMKEFINVATAQNFLTENGDNLSSWLLTLQTRHRESFEKIRQVAKDVFPGLEDVFTFPTQQATVYLASTEKHLKGPVSVWQMSDGQLSFIALLSLIFAPPDLSAGLYCVEELENHLHPQLLETLVELLKQAQDELEPYRSAQVIGTTHSPYLVDKCDLKELIVFERRDGTTQCSRPSDKKHLRELLEREEIGLGDLYYSGALGSS
ncbi:MAG: AAA family ATPase [Candidatus Methylomirabilia bacterium]